MTGAGSSFRDFEHQWWSAMDVAVGYHKHLSALTTQSVEALLDAAGVGSGTRVLDVATGAGYVAAAAAERGAEVVGTDFSATQLALARQHFPALEFRQCDAGALPFPDESFDAVVSNYGMPHFPDPNAFIRESLRVLRNGGHLAYSVWAPIEECIGFGIIYGALEAHGRMDVSLPTGPDFFLFSDPLECERGLAAAGFRPVGVNKVPQIWRLASPDELFEAFMHGTVCTRALLREQTPEALEKIRDAARQGVGAHPGNGGFELPMPAVVAGAEKP